MTTSSPAPENLSDVMHDRAAQDRAFRDDVLTGLAADSKSIPAKHLYDGRGSELFTRICGLDDYYVTRTERSIYDAHLPEIAARLGPEVVLIEPGGGDGEKAEIVLSALDRPAAYVPIEISLDAVGDAATRLAERFPTVKFHPICGDFTKHIDLPEEIAAGRRVVFFPGSTIGNFEPRTRVKILERFAELAGPKGDLLIGFDLIKDPDVLVAAYDDSEKVTAAFNTNLLDRMNRELDADFDPGAFDYEARWNSELGRVEMGQISLKEQRVSVAGESFEFAKGERLHTENSYKFTVERFSEEATKADLRLVSHWTDAREWFCVALFRPIS